MKYLRNCVVCGIGVGHTVHMTAHEFECYKLCQRLVPDNHKDEFRAALIHENRSTAAKRRRAKNAVR
jgi:hypothetical protein